MLGSGRQRRHTPIHVFTVERADGTRRRVAIPGEYCDTRRPTLKPGEREIVGLRTWRSSFDFIDHPANSQPDYQGPASWH